MANDLINLAYIMKPLEYPNHRGFERFQVDKNMECWEGGMSPEGMEAMPPFPYMLPNASHPFGCSWVVFFVINWQ